MKFADPKKVSDYFSNAGLGIFKPKVTKRVRDQAFNAQNEIRTNPRKVAKIVALEYHRFLKDGVTLRRSRNF